MKNKDTLLLEEAYSLILEQQRIQLLQEGIFQDVFNKVKDKLTKFGGDFPKKFSQVYSSLVANPNLSKIMKGAAIAAPLMALAAGNVSGALANLDVNDLKEFVDSVYELITSNNLTDSTLKDTLQSYDVSIDASVYSNKDLASQADALQAGLDKGLDIGNILDNLEPGGTIEAEHVKGITEILDSSLTSVTNDQTTRVASNVIIEVIETKGLDSGSQDVMISVSGDVLASSQEEANKIIQQKIAEVLKQNEISVKGLKNVFGQTFDQQTPGLAQESAAALAGASAKKPFKTKTLVTLNYKAASKVPNK